MFDSVKPDNIVSPGPWVGKIILVGILWTYGLNGIEWTKRCLQFFESYVSLFYAN